MITPPNAEVFELATATIWFDADGILCSITKKVPSQTLEEAKKTLTEFKKDNRWKKILHTF
jgi:hypothetical protein